VSATHLMSIKNCEITRAGLLPRRTEDIQTGRKNPDELDLRVIFNVIFKLNNLRNIHEHITAGEYLNGSIQNINLGA
jgi:hypothetical protein